MTATLCRTHQGMFVHASTCHMANRRNSKAAPWQWADTVPSGHVVAAITTFGYKVCRHCHPIAVLQDKEMEKWLNA